MKQKGFTLIELLVVLIILGLFASLIILTVKPNDNRALQREAKRFMHVISLAQDESIMQGVEFGLNVQSDHYSFSILQDNTWLPITNVPYMAMHEPVFPIIMSLEIEDEQQVQKIEDKSLIPEIMILSSGELTAFKLTLSNQEQPAMQLQIIGKENGQLSLLRHDD